MITPAQYAMVVCLLLLCIVMAVLCVRMARKDGDSAHYIFAFLFTAIGVFLIAGTIHFM